MPLPLPPPPPMLVMAHGKASRGEAWYETPNWTVHDPSPPSPMRLMHRAAGTVRMLVRSAVITLILPRKDGFRVLPVMELVFRAARRMR